jgi:DNA repair protein RecN (Recombination protein N)
MLKTLHIRNFVLLDELTIEFHAGLNIITGETGAGKSILIGALGGLLGERISKEIVRSGADKAVIEGEFDLAEIPAVIEFLQAQDIESQPDSVILRREMSASGKGRCFVNDQPVPVAVLEALGNLLVDLHGQHEHQLLLQPIHHGQYLDAYLNLDGRLAELAGALAGFNALLHELQSLQERAAAAKQKRDYLQYQLGEIDAVNPSAGEDEELKQEEHILKHSEVIFEKTRALFQKLYESEGSVSEGLATAATTLDELAQIDPRFQAMTAECQNARIMVDELAAGLRSYHEGITFDPDRLEKIRVRMSSLAGLKKKFGGQLDHVLEQREKIRQEIDLVDNLDERLASLREELEKQRGHLGKMCQEISRHRSDAVAGFSKQVMALLAPLGMEKAKFDVALHRLETATEPYVRVDGKNYRVISGGLEQIEFMMATNPGEGFKPLSSIASGGEISRVMLALKTLLAEVDRVPVLVFDEIDIGISGRIALAVGKSLRRLSKRHQILCITHLPQIAGMAHYHYLVEKTADDKSTRTTISRLAESERIDQIARLFGGEQVTDASRQSARELVAEAE